MKISRQRGLWEKGKDRYKIASWSEKEREREIERERERERKRGRERMLIC